MNRSLIKNARLKYGLILCTMVISLCFLKKVEGYDSLDAVRVFLGNYPMRKTILILIFIIYTSLIQYLNADQIVLLIRKNTLFLIRYGERKRLLIVLLKNIFCLNIFFTMLIFLALALAEIMCGSSFFLHYGQEVAELGFRAFLMCILCSLLQVILMIKMDEINTFMVMLLISVLYAFLSRINAGIYIKFLGQIAEKEAGLNIIPCISCIVIEIFSCFKLYQRERNP